jgi:hypothetical protein
LILLLAKAFLITFELEMQSCGFVAEGYKFYSGGLNTGQKVMDI